MGEEEGRREQRDTGERRREISLNFLIGKLQFTRGSKIIKRLCTTTNSPESKYRKFILKILFKRLSLLL